MQTLYSSYSTDSPNPTIKHQQTWHLGFFCFLTSKHEFDCFFKVLKVFRINSASFYKAPSQARVANKSSYMPIFRLLLHFVQTYCYSGCTSPVLGLMLAAMWKCPSAFAWCEMWRLTSWVPCWSGNTSVWVTRTEDLLCPFLMFFKWWIVWYRYKK